MRICKYRRIECELDANKQKPRWYVYMKWWPPAVYPQEKAICLKQYRLWRVIDPVWISKEASLGRSRWYPCIFLEEQGIITNNTLGYQCPLEDSNREQPELIANSVPQISLNSVLHWSCVWNFRQHSACRVECCRQCHNLQNICQKLLNWSGNDVYTTYDVRYSDETRVNMFISTAVMFR
jgi:hypothetical protein